MSKPDLEKLKRLTEECHEVTVMWFDKKGRALEGSGFAGSPTLMPALLDHIDDLDKDAALVTWLFQQSPMSKQLCEHFGIKWGGSIRAKMYAAMEKPGA